MLKKSTLNVFILLLYLPLNAQIITTPSSTDTLYLGDTCIIKWKDFDRSHKHVNIDFYQGDKVVEKIVESQRNRKIFRWIIPQSIQTDLSYRVKVSSVTDEKYHCFSGNVLIKKPSIAIIKPNSETEWHVGVSKSIKWDCKGGDAHLNTIKLLRDGRVIKTIAKKASNRGTFRVELATTEKIKTAPNYIVKIVCLNDSSIYSQSQPFRIINNKLLFESLNDIPLIWMPDDDLMVKLYNKDLQHFKDNIFNVVQFIDGRKDTLLIGVNGERVKRRPVTVNESVGKWCHDHLLLVMKENKFNISKTRYDIAIKGIINEFFVYEGSTYDASVSITFQVLSGDDQILWEGTKVGKDKNWGTSYKAMNYYECLSDAYLKAIIELFSDNSVRSAIAQEIIKLE